MMGGPAEASTHTHATSLLWPRTLLPHVKSKVEI